MNRPGSVCLNVHESLYCCTKKEKWGKVKLAQGKISRAVSGDWTTDFDMRSGDRQRKRHGMTNTRFKNFSPRHGDAIICRLEKEKEKKKKKRMKSLAKENHTRPHLTYPISVDIFDLWYENVSLKDSRARWCDGPATVPTEYDTTGEGTEWVFRFLGLSSFFSLPFFFNNLDERQTSRAIKGRWDLFLFPPLSIKLPFIFLFLSHSIAKKILISDDVRGAVCNSWSKDGRIESSGGYSWFGTK